MDINSSNSRYAPLPGYSDQGPQAHIAARIPFNREPSNMDYQNIARDDRPDETIASGGAKHDTQGLGIGSILSRPQITNLRDQNRSPAMEGLLSPTPSNSVKFAPTPNQDNDSISGGGGTAPKLADWQTPSHQSFFTHHGPSTPSVNSAMGLMPASRQVDGCCPTKRDVLTSPWSCLSLPLLLLALYSTIASGLFVSVALIKPRYGGNVGTRGHLSFANASLISAVISKTIELSFVSVFVALLGQVLTRRAFSKANGGGGISLVEMTMRTWIMQPGSLLVSWKDIRYANTIIGAIVLMSAFCATWYTTASEALVSPKLKYGPVQERSLSGSVSASYANAAYLGDNCEVPTAESPDDFKGSTCLQIRHAGMGFSFLSTFMRDWAESVAEGNKSMGGNGFDGRPLPPAVLYDNTTIYGQWITPSQENITTDSDRHGRLVENVTMAMPHAGLFHAVRDPANRILQPDDLQGAGEYFVQASVPVPIVNILCVGLTSEEMSPMIVNVTGTDVYVPNATVVDSIFGWDPESDPPLTPYFPKLPIQYNTIAHIPSVWGPPAISLLATPSDNAATSDHVLCTIKTALYPNCTTRYQVAQSGGLLTVHCDGDSQNTIPYHKSRPDAPVGEWNSDWKDVGGEWIRSLALNNGVSDANASSARLLSQYIPDYSEDSPTTLSATKPSIGEALGVLSGGTLLLSTLNAPFEHTWNYSTTVLTDPQQQTFQARYSYKDYASGGTQGWQAIFYVVLFAVFLLNIAALTYLTWNFTRQGYVTDYTEPQNLFALAINSPPSSALYGACGGGPVGEDMARKFTVDMARTDTDHNGFHYQPHTNTGKHPHFFIRSQEMELSPMIPFSPATPNVNAKQAKYRRSRPPTMNEAYGTDSPVIEQYHRLTRGF